MPNNDEFDAIILESHHYVGVPDDERIVVLEDDGWGHELPPGSTPPEFDTREEEWMDRL